MTGERLIWLKLASHLGMSLQRCQQETTSGEFVEWMRYFELEPNMFHREDHYWAQIAAWIKRSGFQNPENVQDEDFLLKFKRPESERGKAEATGARSFFGRLLGLKKGQRHGRSKPRKHLGSSRS